MLLFPSDCEDTMRLVPVGDNVILKREQSEERSTGGIVLPDTAQEKPVRGRILAVGDGSTLANGSRAAPMVAEGDRVLFGRYAGTEVEIDGEAYLILRESEILAVFE